MNAWYNLSFALGKLLMGKPSPGRSLKPGKRPKRNNKATGKPSRRRPAKPGLRPKRSNTQFKGKPHQQSGKKVRRSKNHGSSHRPAKRGGREIVAFHGTPSVANVRSIFRDGWMIGNGNLLGDGVYFTSDLATAKRYAGSGGLVIKCNIRAGRQIRQSAALGRELAQWCQRCGVANDNSARTAYLLQKGYDTLIDGSTIVVLAPRYANPSAWKRRIHRVKIKSVHRANNGSRVHV